MPSEDALDEHTGVWHSIHWPHGGRIEVEINLLRESLSSVEIAERLDIYIYECPTCGEPIYMTHEKSAGGDIDSGDRDSFVGAPRKPAPIVNSSAIAVPEPDEDGPTESS